MYTSYSNSPPIYLIKTQISKSAKRIAIVQSVMMSSIVILIGLLYSIIDELLPLFEVATDMEAMQIALTDIIEAHTEIFSAITIILVVVAVTGIMYLLAAFRLARSFRLLARIIPQVAKPAFSAGNFIRIALYIQIGSIVIGAFIGVGMSYITQIASVGAYVLLVAAYFNIAQTFKILRTSNLYPEKESRLLFYSQIVPVASMIPLTFSITQLSSGAEIELIPLIIGGVIIILGYVGLLVGFYKLSKDVMLIDDGSAADYNYEPNSAYTAQEQPKVDYQNYVDTTSVKVEQPSKTIQDKTSKGEMLAQFCPNCGQKLKKDKAFCHSCGAKVEEF